MKHLEDALIMLETCYDAEYNSIYLEKDFYSPGFLCTLAAFIDLKKVGENNFDAHPDTMGYLRTACLHKVLWDIDDNIDRKNCGNTYSPLTALKSVGEVDSANTTINNCIRHLIGNKQSTGISGLYQVVGELLDNVWSHGMSTGYSMAQRSAVPFTNHQDYFIEFSLVDRGIGFLEELRRAKKEILANDHESAISWCIQKGNSSKHADDVDEWAQRLPEDHLGSDPMAGFGGQVPENHHQGLGLAHLTELVKNYNGELQLCTGDTLFKIDSNGEESYTKLQTLWQGVAVSCKFKESNLLKLIQRDQLEELRINAIIEKLRGTSS